MSINRLNILALCFLVAFAGCSKNYLAEREFYKARKVLESIKLSAPLEELDKPIDAFQLVADRFPGTPKAMESLIVISNLRLKQKKYDQAQEALKSVIENFSSDKDKVADARDRMAQIHQAEGNWNAAEKTYWELAELSSLHARGLYAPIKVMLHYKQAKDDKGFEQQYVRALDHFEGLVKQLGPIDAAAAVKNYLAMTHMIHGDNEKAMQVWEAIYKEHHENGYAPLSLLAAAEVAWKVEDVHGAERYWGLYYKDYPKHSLAGKTAVTVGMLYHGRKDFEKARSWYGKASTDYFSSSPSDLAEIKLLTAKSFQDEGKWEDAEKVYGEIEKDQPNSVFALQIPLLRATHFKEAGDLKKSQEILNEAIALYENLEATLPANDPSLAFATRFKTAAYAQKGAWEDMMKEVDEQMAQETLPDKKGRWLFLKALLAENRLKDSSRAKELYESFLSQYPAHPLAQRAKAQLEGLAKAA